MKVNPKIAVAGGLAAVVAVGVIISVSSSDGSNEAASVASKPGEVGDNEPAVFAAWKKSGHWVGDFKAAAKPVGSGTCLEGSVDGLEVLFCTYADDAAAEAAKFDALARVGETTGTALARGKELVVIADRSNSDPSGRTLNRLAKTFRGR